MTDIEQENQPMTDETARREDVQFVAGIMSQMAADAHHTSNKLINHHGELGNRFVVLHAAVLDLADTVDSRNMGQALRNLAFWVSRMPKEVAETTAEYVGNRSLWGETQERLPGDVYDKLIAPFQ